ncbi:MAG: hypothetical protein AMXMBFR47_38970 [Planctomycetota bacterium]
MRRASRNIVQADPRRAKILAALDEIVSQRLAGATVHRAELAARWPELLPDLTEALDELELVENAREAATAVATGSSALQALGGQPIPPALHGIAGHLVGYEVLREVHRGGQGVVYEAVQNSTRRRVAIKILRGGPLSTDRDIARFDREVRILAGLRHPNIVTILDRGVAGGFDYFVMDFVDGLPFDRFVTQRQYSPRDTVELMVAVCDAVAAAHARGVIHRDLKPSNVLVAEGPSSTAAPHILDFGLAKLTLDDDSDTAAARTVTETGQFLGSLPWTSPEQAAGRSDAVDVRSDVYSLGVMLYGALAGTLPYSREGSLGEIIARIIHIDPQPPSRRRPSIGADLDAIVLTCLAKSPAGRYQSVTQLGDDLRRYLAGDPVLARSPGPGERAIRFLRRNRMLVGASLSVFLALFAGLAGTTWKALAEIRERQRAQKEVDKQRAIRSVLESILISPDPFFGAGQDARVMDVMDRVADRLSEDLRGQPEVEADIRLTLANSYRHLGRLAEAEQNLARGIALRAEIFGRDSIEAIEPEIIRGYLHETAGRFCEAEQAYRRVIDGLRAARGADDADALTYCTHLGRALRGLGRLDEAEQVLTAAAAAQAKAFGEEHEKTLYTRQMLAGVLGATRRTSEALAMIGEIIEARRRIGGEDHPATLSARAAEALILLDDDRAVEAEAILRLVSAAAESRLGSDHQTTLSMRCSLARVLLRLGQFEQAETLAAQVFDRSRSLPGRGQALEAARDVWVACLRAGGKDAQAAALEAEASALESHERP